jgi:hypothetical protein
MAPDSIDSPTEFLVDCISLAAGATLSVIDPRALRVYVPQGRVWITEENEAADVILDPGGWHRLDRPGHAVVEAFTPAVVMLTSPHETGYARDVVARH